VSVSDDALPSRVPALVIGAGPAGLAAAAELKRTGIDALVLEKAGRVGSSWTTHYDRLHLHTSRGLSHLPGYRIPSRFGRWVARDDVLRYLADYAAHHELDVRLGVAAGAIEPVAGGGWSIPWARGTESGVITADAVIVATGYNHTPKIPDWPGRDEFAGAIVHSAAYQNPQALGAQRVLVVGPGNSGAEIAADLADAGMEVAVAMRTPPNIVLRAVAGVPSQALVISMAMLPVKAQDALAGALQSAVVGNLSRYGVPKAPRGIATQQLRDDVTPTIDVGFIKALKAGKVRIVPAVERFTSDSVALADGSIEKPDAVVVATGFSRGLEDLVGHLGVLAPKGRPLVNADQQLDAYPGLYFLGYSNPLTGNLRQLGIDAKRIARGVSSPRESH
jgi:cation diffusion facilitator CzcD-associated flavoprotein CzcO